MPQQLLRFWCLAKDAGPGTAPNCVPLSCNSILQQLLHFDKDNVDEVLVAAVEAKFLSDPEFEPEKIRGKSGAAADLCSWCICMCKYSRIYQVVRPIRAALAAANAKLSGVRDGDGTFRRILCATPHLVDCWLLV